MTLTLSNVQLQEFIQRWRNGVQPWGDFLNTHKFALPKALSPAGRRMLKNVEHFRSNYIFVVICVIAFAVYVAFICCVYQIVDDLLSIKLAAAYVLCVSLWILDL